MSRCLPAAALALAAACLAGAPTQAHAQIIPIDTDVTNRAGRVVGTFEGTLEITEFIVEDGELIALGVVNGVNRNPAGQVRKTITDQAVELPVLDAEVLQTDGVCDVLTLTLGPLDLDLLGLIVHLDQVFLDIDADPTGGLLGQLLSGLLCNLGDLLDDLLGGLDVLGDIADLLNDILDLLNNPPVEP
jgi:hypothetical protein